MSEGVSIVCVSAPCTFMYSFSTSSLRDVIFSMNAAGDNPKSSQQMATASKDALTRDQGGEGSVGIGSVRGYKVWDYSSRGYKSKGV